MHTRRPITLRLSLTLLLLACLPACGAGLYELPPPPPEGQRRDVSLIPGEEERKKERIYLKARDSVQKLYSLLSAKRYAEALKWVSAETRDFLAYGAPKGSAEKALAMGVLTLPSGAKVKFDPVSLLTASDVTVLEDTIEGIKENESERRKEIFAVVKNDNPRRIVVIKQGDRWVVHRTSIGTKDSP